MKWSKLIRRVASGIALLAAMLPASPARCAEANGPAADSVKVPIIMYHSVLEGQGQWGAYVISPAELEGDLKYLKANGYTPVTMQELVNYVYEGGPLPEKPVVLTFDDGYYNNYLYAYPLLKKYDMKAVLSIIGRYTDAYSLTDADHPLYSHITWNEAIEMANSGLVEIQNHSYNLHTISRERTASMRVSGEPIQHYETVLLSDTIRLQALIDGYTRRLPTTYTYPFGLISKDSVGILKDAGFKATLTCYSGINTVTRNPDCLYLLKRNLRPHGRPVSSILQKYQ